MPFNDDLKGVFISQNSWILTAKDEKLKVF